MRDYQKYEIFRRSNAAIPQVYAVCDSLPASERYGISTQLRRAAISVRSNIVEGAKRRTDLEFAHFLNMAEASAAEARELLKDVVRFGLDVGGTADRLQREYAEIILMLRAFQNALRR